MKLDIYKNKKILITGSTGFKGSWLSFWLKKLGADVTGVALKPEKGSFIFNSLKLDKNIQQFYVDIKDRKKLSKIIKTIKPDIIFHLAAQSVVLRSIDKPLETFETNIMGSLNILEEYRNNNINSLVFCTSDKCYENKEWIWGYRETDHLGGKDPYSASKACAEIIFSSYFRTYLNFNKNNKVGSVRAGNVIGGGDFKENRIIPDMIKSILKKKDLILRSPKSTRPWQHVLDPLYGYLLLGSNLLQNKLCVDLPSWNFGPDINDLYDVNYIAKSFINKWDSKIKIKSINKNKNESHLLQLNSEKAKLELGWKPTLILDETIDYTYQWYYDYFIKGESSITITNRQIDSFTNKNENR